MPRAGKCPNFNGCLLASRNDVIVIADGDAFLCPECGQPLVEGSAARKVIPMAILGGISLLVVMGIGAVYFQTRHLRDKPAPGQIGTSFEQAQVAGEHGEFLPSRHMASPIPAVSPIPEASVSPGASAAPSPER